MTAQPHDPAFESLLEFLKVSRGFDFTGYKRSTLVRRVQKRMQVHQLGEFEAYREFLERHPEEYEALFNTILINVTAFFRDPEAWQVLADEFVPALLARKDDREPVRVWSAGCATGQETYSLVMLLAEALGPEQFRDRVKVYATDWDEEALAYARRAAYTEDETDGLPDGYRDRYFVRANGGWSFRPDLRRQVIFGRHDLVQDAPISHLDLLACRNVLMYFNAELQQRILVRFHFALAPQGVLFLGKAEMMRAHGTLFTPADLPARLFRKTVSEAARERLLPPGGSVAARRQAPDGADGLALRDAALNAFPAAQFAVGTAGHLLLMNDAARRLFTLSSTDLGRPLQDLKVSYRPVELRSRIEQAVAERRPVYVDGVEHAGDDGGPRRYDVQVCPLEGPAGALLGVSVTFFDVTRSARLQAEVEEANLSLETAFEELQSTNEELETTNEELHSTVEELETTNEELQSTNEELETINQELQSTNQELETLNDELQRRSAELNDANAYLSSVLAGLRAAVVVVDRDMRVQLWNRQMEEMWGLRADEVQSRPLLHLDVGLPVERLKEPVRAVLEGRAGMQELELDTVDRQGRRVRCRVTTAPLLGVAGEIRGSVLVIEQEPNGAGSGTEAADGAA